MFGASLQPGSFTPKVATVATVYVPILFKGAIDALTVKGEVPSEIALPVALIVGYGLIRFLAPYRARVALALVALIVAAGTVLVFGSGLRWLIDHGRTYVPPASAPVSLRGHRINDDMVSLVSPPMRPDT